MYTTLGLPKGDRERMRAQVRRNYEFFDAPVALLFTLHRLMVPGSVLDLGMLMQSIMVSAQVRGIATCSQAALANYHHLLARELPLDPDEVLICGMAMGYADQEAPVNLFPVQRVGLETMAVFHE
jgi:nitroreductase